MSSPGCGVAVGAGCAWPLNASGNGSGAFPAGVGFGTGIPSKLVVACAFAIPVSKSIERQKTGSTRFGDITKGLHLDVCVLVNILRKRYVQMVIAQRKKIWAFTRPIV